MSIAQRFKNLQARLDASRLATAADTFALYDAEFQDGADLVAYRNWLDDEHEKRQQLRQATVTLEELVQLVDSTNFVDADSSDKLLNTLLVENQPCIPLGRDGAGNRYRIVPEPFGLELDPRTDESNHILNIYISYSQEIQIVPKEHSSSNYSHSTTTSRSTDTTLSDSGGSGSSRVNSIATTLCDGRSSGTAPAFIAYQLGDVQYSTLADEAAAAAHNHDDNDDEDLKREEDDPAWNKTPFQLVARIDVATGRIHSFYAVSSSTRAGSLIPAAKGERSACFKLGGGVSKRLADCAQDFSTPVAWEGVLGWEARLRFEVANLHECTG